MTIVKILPYQDNDIQVLAVASSDEEVQKIKDLTEEFARLDSIYAMHDEQNQDYQKAVEVVENGLSEYLESQGITLPPIEVVEL